MEAYFKTYWKLTTRADRFFGFSYSHLALNPITSLALNPMKIEKKNRYVT